MQHNDSVMRGDEAGAAGDYETGVLLDGGDAGKKMYIYIYI